MAGGTDAKARDHNQRGAVVVLKRKMRHHHVKVFGVIQPFRAQVVHLVGARMLGVKKPDNLRYGVAVESFNLGKFGLRHCGSGVVGKLAHVAAWEAHGDDVVLRSSV